MARKGEYKYDWAKAIRMLAAGGPKKEVTDAIGVSPKNFASLLRKAVAAGWTVEGPPEGGETKGQAKHTAIHSAIQGMASFNQEELHELREVLTWWRDRKGGESGSQAIHPAIRSAIQKSHTRKKWTFWIEEGVYEVLKARAEQKGRSMADLVNEAIRLYLGE